MHCSDGSGESYVVGVSIVLGGAGTRRRRAVRASRHDSSGAPVSRALSPGARRAALALALAGGVLLVLSELLPVLEVAAGGTTRTVSGHAQHGWALGALGVLSVALGVGAFVLGSRAARLALLAVGLTALLIALVGDAPDATRTGLVRERGALQLASASPRSGFVTELAGASLLLLSGLAGLLLGRRSASEESPTGARLAPAEES